jgi:hypothetical protein
MSRVAIFRRGGESGLSLCMILHAASRADLHSAYERTCRNAIAVGDTKTRKTHAVAARDEAMRAAG